MRAIATAKAAAPIIKALRNLGKFTVKNGNWMWALMAMAGLAGTAWQAVDATIKAVKLCEEKEVHGAKEVIKTVWKLYIPGAGFFILTTIAIGGQAHLSSKLSKQLMTATGLYAASQADLKAMKDKTKELFGERKEKKIEEEIDQDRVKKMPKPDEKDIVKTGHGNQLFQLTLNGGYFRANPDWIRNQIRTADEEIQTDPTNVLYAHRILELFHQPEADIGNLFWDLCDMREKGYKHLTVDISSCRWDDHGDDMEVVSLVKIEPWPTGF